jgi:hypothetical protein
MIPLKILRNDRRKDKMSSLWNNTINRFLGESDQFLKNRKYLPFDMSPYCMYKVSSFEDDMLNFLKWTISLV